MHQPESNGSNARISFERVARWARGSIGAVGIIVLAVSLGLETVNLPFTHWRVDRSFGVAAGLLLVGVAWLLLFAPARAALATCALSGALLATFVIGYRPPRRGDVALDAASLSADRSADRRADGTHKVWVSEIEWYDQYLRPDPRWGHGGIPNIVAHHHHREFEVDYSLDGEGWRVMPTPKAAPPSPPPLPVGEILFLGCSFTFGIGVEDGETYPAVLAAGPWSSFRVRNHAHSAWGTTHALLFLEHRLRAEPKPAAVFYAWISRHARRNYRRKSWHQQSGLPFPHFELEEGRPRFLGMLKPVEADLPDGPDLDHAEAEMSLALVRALGRACAERDIPFFVLALYDGEPKPDLVLPRLRAEEGLALIDLTRESDDLYPLNLHPTKFYHRAIARALASNQDLAEAAGKSELYEPDAIAPPPCAWHLQANPTFGAWATIERPDDPDSPFRITRIHRGSAATERWAISLRRRPLSVRAGHRYTVRLRLRADAKRPLHINVSQDHPPWAILGFGADLELVPEWRDFEYSFVCDAEDAESSLVFHLAGSEVPFEAQRIVLSDGQTDLITGRPLAETGEAGARSK